MNMNRLAAIGFVVVMLACAGSAQAQQVYVYMGSSGVLPRPAAVPAYATVAMGAKAPNCCCPPDCECAALAGGGGCPCRGVVTSAPPGVMLTRPSGPGVAIVQPVRAPGFVTRSWYGNPDAPSDLPVPVPTMRRATATATGNGGYNPGRHYYYPPSYSYSRPAPAAQPSYRPSPYYYGSSGYLPAPTAGGGCPGGVCPPGR